MEENGRFKALEIEGEQYKPSQRFLKGMAQRMKVPLSVFELFTPLEVIRRAAERVPVSASATVRRRTGSRARRKCAIPASRRECVRALKARIILPRRWISPSSA